MFIVSILSKIGCSTSDHPEISRRMGTWRSFHGVIIEMPCGTGLATPDAAIADNSTGWNSEETSRREKQRQMGWRPMAATP
ncbi:hypothetical protein [Sphingomonas sp. Leaf21]|uniref:hypothetical protein n=1 Tax=Sphingomonas sp. Leaf21 TaxID=2876550 RepID=UPI001E5A11C9|nr:hypothetical protein [Sphingomonas sp. Leaf21]